MERILLNNELELTCPDGFRSLDQEEMKKFTFANEQPGCVLESEEQHMIVSLAWHRIGILLSLLFSPREMAGKMAEYIAKADKDYNHRQGEFFDRTIDGSKASGFDYSYTAQNIEMESRMIVAKRGRNLYCIYFYFRKALHQQSVQLMEEIISSMSWKPVK